MKIERHLLYGILTALLMVLSPSLKAANNYAYFGIEPDIVTNYVSNGSSRLGYLRVTIELMVENAEYLPIVEHHSPLLRATLIEIIGKQTEGDVKSLVGRENIRRDMIKVIQHCWKTSRHVAFWKPR